MKNILFPLLLLLFVILSIPVETSAQKPGDPVYTSEFGVQMYTYRNIIDEQGIEATLDIIQENGITLIEGGPSGGASLQEFKSMLDERGLRLASMGADYNKLVENPEQIAKDAKALGAEYVMIAWIPHTVGSFNFVNASQAVEDFNKAGKVLAEHGITLKYHYHGYEIIPHKEGTLLDYMMENTNPDYVSFQMDVYWIQFGGGNPEHLLQEYSDRWVSFHLKDMEKGTLKDHTGLSDNNTNVVLGTGEIDFSGIIKAANDLGISLFFLEDESDRLLEQIPESIAYLKSLTY
ncbi:MAG: sugar phosphate isomerase/epimerase [Balneolaceae bacterium]|nr:sugar phosphate isomerase/epimerase [Balneolaceae bacterium]MBO6546858.1 sugar phosphate isomerase/epimerase [Balneolaceae bacterium]MBO6649218.1 sugar phosphate isomerase/epimerase [Balneolaceae bacterium]